MGCVTNSQVFHNLTKNRLSLQTKNDQPFEPNINSHFIGLELQKWVEKKYEQNRALLFIPLNLSMQYFCLDAKK